MTTKARLNICTTCTASSAEEATDPRHGRELFDKMVESCAKQDMPFDIRAVECLTNCKSGCSVALSGPGKWGYVYGNLDTGMIDDLCELGRRGIIQLMVEGGGALHGSFLSGRLANQLRLYVGATALGSTSRRWIQAPIATTMADAPRWKLLGSEVVGDDVCLDYALSDELE